MSRILNVFAVAALTMLLVPAEVFGQQGRGGPPPAARTAATTDLTGYWVSVVTEDWLYRMVTPAKGDRRNVPLNAAGIAATNAWDPAKDELVWKRLQACRFPNRDCAVLLRVSETAIGEADTSRR